jgi:pimeloyl-ACP methyl ester carboxylesterase
VARRLIKVLPNVTVVELADLGHMGPITDPDLVNRAIEDFMLNVL